MILGILIRLPSPRNPGRSYNPETSGFIPHGGRGRTSWEIGGKFTATTTRLLHRALDSRGTLQVMEERRFVVVIALHSMRTLERSPASREIYSRGLFPSIWT